MYILSQEKSLKPFSLLTFLSLSLFGTLTIFFFSPTMSSSYVYYSYAINDELFIMTWTVFSIFYVQFTCVQSCEVIQIEVFEIRIYNTWHVICILYLNLLRNVFLSFVFQIIYSNLYFKCNF